VQSNIGLTVVLKFESGPFERRLHRDHHLIVALLALDRFFSSTFRGTGS
jgi:hypothetical protein